MFTIQALSLAFIFILRLRFPKNLSLHENTRKVFYEYNACMTTEVIYEIFAVLQN